MRQVAVGTIVVMGLAAPALAESAVTAKEYARQAASEYNLGRFAEAAALFERAYRFDPAPILLFNIGQCHRRLGDNERALFFYRRYLQEAPPDVPDRKEVEKRVAELERSVREQAELKNRPPPGIQSEAASGERPTGAQPNTGPSPTMVAAPVPPGVSAMAPLSKSDEGSRGTMRTLAWVAGGGAVAAAGAGFLLNLAARSNRADFDGSCVNMNGIHMVPGQALTQSDCVDRYEGWQSDRLWSIAGYVAGAALAVTSGTLFWISRPTSPSGSVHAHLACGPTPSGVACQGVF